MTATTNERYLTACEEHFKTYAHKFSDTWIEDVLVNGEWKMVGFQKVDDMCFILIGTRNWATRYTAMSATEAMAAGGVWYEVTKEEGNVIYKQILKSKKISKKGKTYYTWNF